MILYVFVLHIPIYKNINIKNIFIFQFMIGEDKIKREIFFVSFFFEHSDHL